MSFTTAEIDQIRDIVREETVPLQNDIKAIYYMIADMQKEMREFRKEMRSFREELNSFREEMRYFKDEMSFFKEEMLALRRDVNQLQDLSVA